MADGSLQQYSLVTRLQTGALLMAHIGVLGMAVSMGCRGRLAPCRQQRRRSALPSALPGAPRRPIAAARRPAAAAAATAQASRQIVDIMVMYRQWAMY
jgi:hypothetical protein